MSEEAWDKLLARWATDRGISRDAAILACSGSPRWAEARQRAALGATEFVVWQLLDAGHSERQAALNTFQ